MASWNAAPCPRAAPSGATRSSFSTNWPAKADPICSCVASRSGTRKRTLVFLTNHRSFAASTIAAIYQSRWQIELFFKALKQNLRIKTFVGTSPNALQIQIWTALIALLLLKYLQLRARFGWSLSNLAALLRQQLFVYRDLWAWIDEPFQPPPLLDTVAQQIPLPWSSNLDSRTTTSTQPSQSRA